MNNQFDVKSLYRAIASLAKHEAVTKEVLSGLSRSILSLHLNEGASQHDVKVVNKLLTVLSPANKRIARMFFEAFLPYTFDSEAFTFGKLIKKEGARDLKYLAMASFLHEEGNDIWAWQAEHVSMEAKPVNYAMKISKAIEAALKEDKGALTPAQVLEAVFAGGVSVNDVVAMLEGMAQPKEQLAKAA